MKRGAGGEPPPPAMVQAQSGEKTRTALERNLLSTGTPIILCARSQEAWLRLQRWVHARRPLHPLEGFMLDALWAVFFGGQVEQQVLIVNSATLSDAYDYRRRFYVETDGEVPTRI
jgi:hypothetical protein